MSQLQFLLSKASKLKALVSQMERHNTLNQSDMPLVCGILSTEMHAILCAAKNLENMLKARRSAISERLSVLSPKVDSGRFIYAEKEERDKLVNEYLELEKQLEFQNET